MLRSPTDYPDPAFTFRDHHHSRSAIAACADRRCHGDDEARALDGAARTMRMWIPAGIEHSVEMIGDVAHALDLCHARRDRGAAGRHLHVVGHDTALMDSLIGSGGSARRCAGRTARRTDHGSPAARNSEPAGTAARPAFSAETEAGGALPAAFWRAPRRMPISTNGPTVVGMSRRTFTRAVPPARRASAFRPGGSRPACSQRCRGWRTASRSPVSRSISAMTAFRPSPPCSSACWAPRRAAICAARAMPARVSAAKRSRQAGECDGLVEQARHRFFGRRARDRFAHQGGDRDDADVGSARPPRVGWIELVITSSCSFEPVMRATAPPDSTPWVM